MFHHQTYPTYEAYRQARIGYGFGCLSEDEWVRLWGPESDIWKKEVEYR